MAPVPKVPTKGDTTSPIQEAAHRYRGIWHSFESQMVRHASTQSLNIHKSQLGRGSTLERTWISEDFVPLRPSRPGSFTPAFHGQNMTHTRWVRQLRRLQALAHMKIDHASNPHWIERRLGTWHAINRAAGFSPSFVQWWNNKAKHVAGLPDRWPQCPPDQDHASRLALDFQTDLMHFEQMLLKARQHKAKEARLNNPAKVFQDLQAPKPEPVQMLLAHTLAAIEAVDTEDCSVVLDSANAFDPTQTIEHNGNPLSIIHYDTDKLWLAHLPELRAGDTLCQSHPVTDLDAIHKSFATEWMARWDRHAHTHDSKWEPIVDFVRCAFPSPPQMHYKPVTYETWQDAVKRKKTHAAVGPDGVSRADLLALPRNHVEPILNLLQDIEAGDSAWPSQVVTGHVHALEKIPNAWKASQYRPLTVFSIIYRTWSSIRARETLKYLGQFVPDQITGNIPGKACTDLWLSIQLTLEDAHTDSSPLAGVVADLVKAYNLLPRIPLLAIGLHLGIPKPIIRAWANALRQLTRAFSVRGTIGPMLSSTTGFAEGCGLSCSAMLICNIALARWLRIRFPSVRMWSYVDNLELTAPSTQEAAQGLTLMTQFCDLMDLQIDTAKTYFWSTQADDRHAARQAELPLLSSARRTTNHVLRARLNDVPRVWTALARSPAPYRQKTHALRVKGWPQALSAGTSASLGPSHLQALRTGACRGLKIHAPGISPLVHLSLIEHPMTDPGCNLLLQTVHTFRRHANHDQVNLIMETALRDWSELRHRPGPCHVLLERLHAIGWQWLGQGWVADHLNRPLDLLQGSSTEIRLRLLEGWQIFVQRCVSRRKTFQGIEWANAAFTMEKLSSWPQAKLGLIRKVLNGAFFTADTQLHNRKAHTLTCKFCGQPDSQFHRFWECAHFREDRPYPWLVQKVREGGLPRCLTYHGWMGLPPEAHALQQALYDQPDLTGVFEHLPFQPVDLFLDGSCINPTCSITRLAGWGIVASNPQDQDHWSPLAQGVVPGRIQTSQRAEITAAISALKYAWRQGGPLRLWSDNALVVNTLRHALTNPDQCKYGQKDQDLWRLLVTLAGSIPRDMVTVHKIASHQMKHGADMVELWAFTGNDLADHVAQWSTRFPNTLVTTWHHAVQALEAARTLRNQVHATMLQVSEAAIRKEVPLRGDDPPQVPAPLTLTEATIGPLPALPQTATHKLVGEAWSPLSRWSIGLCDTSAEVRFLPWLYLYLDFVLVTNYGGVKPSSGYKTWTWFSRQAASSHAVVTRVKWFRLMLIRVYKSESRPLSSEYARPSSRILTFWAHCVCCRISPERFKAIEQLLVSCRATYTCGMDIESITI